MKNKTKLQNALLKFNSGPGILGYKYHIDMPPRSPAVLMQSGSGIEYSQAVPLDSCTVGIVLLVL